MRNQSDEPQRGGFLAKKSKDFHLNPSGEDSLVVEDGVAKVEVVVLNAWSYSEPRLQAARTGLQQGRLGEEKKG